MKRGRDVSRAAVAAFVLHCIFFSHEGERGRGSCTLGSLAKKKDVTACRSHEEEGGGEENGAVARCCHLAISQIFACPLSRTTGYAS